jgi:hypothetical protein
MTMHQCPKCELRFTWQTELDDHCRTDHPQFHHEYPASAAQREVQEQKDQADAEAKPADNTSAILKTWWTER